MSGPINTLWLQSPVYRLPPHGDYFGHGPESIDYIAAADGHQQGEYMTPTPAVTNCYDMDGFNRVKRRRGNALIDRVMQDATTDTNVQPSGQFVTWNHIRLATPCAVLRSASCIAAGTNRIRWTLEQAYHPGWSAASCNLRSSATGALMVDCPAPRVLEGPIDLVFKDPTSNLGTHVSSVTWSGRSVRASRTGWASPAACMRCCPRNEPGSASLRFSTRKSAIGS